MPRRAQARLYPHSPSHDFIIDMPPRPLLPVKAIFKADFKTRYRHAHMITSISLSCAQFLSRMPPATIERPGHDSARPSRRSAPPSPPFLPRRLAILGSSAPRRRHDADQNSWRYYAARRCMYIMRRCRRHYCHERRCHALPLLAFAISDRLVFIIRACLSWAGYAIRRQRLSITSPPSLSSRNGRFDYFFVAICAFTLFHAGFLFSITFHSLLYHVATCALLLPRVTSEHQYFSAGHTAVASIDYLYLRPLAASALLLSGSPAIFVLVDRHFHGDK